LMVAEMADQEMPAAIREMNDLRRRLGPIFGQLAEQPSIPEDIAYAIADKSFHERVAAGVARMTSKLQLTMLDALDEDYMNPKQANLKGGVAATAVASLVNSHLRLAVSHEGVNLEGNRQIVALTYPFVLFTDELRVDIVKAGRKLGLAILENEHEHAVVVRDQ